MNNCNVKIGSFEFESKKELSTIYLLTFVKKIQKPCKSNNNYIPKFN